MIYLVIKRPTEPNQPGTVFQVHRDHPGDGYGPNFDVKPWYGPMPQLHDPDDPENPVESYDPTFNDPQYTTFTATRADFDNLADRADNEIEWLGDVIPQIDDMTIEQLRGVLKHLVRLVRFQIKAWRYVFRHLDRRP